MDFRTIIFHHRHEYRHGINLEVHWQLASRCGPSSHLCELWPGALELWPPWATCLEHLDQFRGTFNSFLASLAAQLSIQSSNPEVVTFWNRPESHLASASSNPEPVV